MGSDTSKGAYQTLAVLYLRKICGAYKGFYCSFYVHVYIMHSSVCLKYFKRKNIKEQKRINVETLSISRRNFL